MPIASGIPASPSAALLGPFATVKKIYNQMSKDKGKITETDLNIICLKENTEVYKIKSFWSSRLKCTLKDEAA